MYASCKTICDPESQNQSQVAQVYLWQ